MNLVSNNFDYVWHWTSHLPERKGNKCRVLAKGYMNSILIEFEDNKKVLTSKYAIRPIKMPKNKNYFNRRKN